MKETAVLSDATPSGFEPIPTGEFRRRQEEKRGDLRRFVFKTATIVVGGLVLSGSFALVASIKACSPVALSLTPAFARASDLERLRDDNKTMHQTDAEAIDKIDERTDVLYQVLVDGTPKSVAKTNAAKRRAAARKGQP